MGPLTRREFLNLSVAGAVVVVAPAVSYAAMFDHDPTPAPTSSLTAAPPSSRVFFHQSGVLRTRQWQCGDAQAVIDGHVVTLTSPGLGTTSFHNLDVESGFAREQIRIVMGPEITEEIFHELFMEAVTPSQAKRKTL